MGEIEVSPTVHVIQLSVAPVLREIFVATSNLRSASRHVHGRRSVPAFFLVAVASAAIAGAQTSPTLPKGVRSVTFGTAQRYSGAGKEMCAILKPLAEPATFEPGVTEISYAVELEARTVTKAAAQVIGSAPQPLRAVPCNVFTPIPGGFSQTQLGHTISRTDNAPLTPGPYTLRVTVDGQTVDVPFTIRTK